MSKINMEIQISKQRKEKIKSCFEELTGLNPNNNEDIYIFGYGSILWNPFFEYFLKETGKIVGYERRFCIKSTIVRGTPEIPGLLLALVEKKESVTVGEIFKVNKEGLMNYLMWEMSTGCYLAKWLKVQRSIKKQCYAVTLLAREDHHQYEGTLTSEETAQRICRAEGTRGTCLEYFTNTVEQLEKVKVKDSALEKIKDQLLSICYQ